MMTPRNKILILWMVFLLGLLFHTDLGLMPLFHGLDVTVSKAQSLDEIGTVLWLMLGFFVPPMFVIVATAFTDAKPFRQFHWGLTILYSLLNFAHLIADLSVPPIAWYQIVLMAILLAIGCLLNWTAWQWLKE